MRLLFLLLLAATGINAPSASAQSWSDVLVRSRTPPPESYLAVVKALGSLGLRATHDPAWSAFAEPTSTGVKAVWGKALKNDSTISASMKAISKLGLSASARAQVKAGLKRSPRSSIARRVGSRPPTT